MTRISSGSLGVLLESDWAFVLMEKFMRNLIAILLTALVLGCAQTAQVSDTSSDCLNQVILSSNEGDLKRYCEGPSEMARERPFRTKY